MSIIPDDNYSDKYHDDIYEYSFVILPSSIAKKLPKPMRILTESEWRAIGVRKTNGWIHYDIHTREPYILLFRRPRRSKEIGLLATKSEKIESQIGLIQEIPNN